MKCYLAGFMVGLILIAGVFAGRLFARLDRIIVLLEKAEAR